MTEQLKEQFQKRLINYQADKGISYNQIAGLCKVNAAYISAIVNGKWNEHPAGNGNTVQISDKIFLKIQQALGFETDLFETENYQAIFNKLMECKLHKSYGIIDGPTGAGKTFAVTHFAQLHPRETYLVTAANNMSAKQFAIAVAKAVGASEQGNSHMICKAIAEKLNRDTNPLLIIDECETLFKHPQAFGSIKDIYNDIEKKVGIVLVGANKFIAKLQKLAAKDVDCFPQLYSRFEVAPAILSEPTLEDCQQIGNAFGMIQKADIRRLYDTSNNYRKLFNTARLFLQDSQFIQS